MRKVLLTAALVCSIALLAAAPAATRYPQPEYKDVVPGVAYGTVRLEQPSLVYYVVKVDLSGRGYAVRMVNAREGEYLASLSERVVNEGGKLIAAINGDYFDRGEHRVPKGILVAGNELLFSPAARRSAFVLDARNRPFIDVPRMGVKVALGSASQWKEIVKVNRLRDKDEKGIFLYTSGWRGAVPAVQAGQTLIAKSGPLLAGKETRGELVKILPGESVDVPDDGFALTMDRLPSFVRKQLEQRKTVRVKVGFVPDAREAIGGGPRLVRSRRPSVEFSREGFSTGERNYLERKRHPRSAVGYGDSRQTVILCTVQGRCSESAGLTSKEMAELMVALGATDAMAFDGGGSVGLFVDGKVVMSGNSHGGRPQHRVLANALGVFAVAGGE